MDRDGVDRIGLVQDRQVALTVLCVEFVWYVVV
jgi:hypothetical protein